MEYKRELLFKILVLGDFGVGKYKIQNNYQHNVKYSFLGKTSIVKRYAEGKSVKYFYF